MYAVSCVECRRRKIKCDRNVPCTQCTQYKNASCSYKDGYPGPKNAQANSTTPAVPPQRNGDLGSCGFVVPVVSDGANVEKSKPYGSMPRTVPVFASHSASTTVYSPGSGSPEEPPTEQNVQVLSDRVSQLEKNLKTLSPRCSEPLWLSAIDNPTFFGTADRVPVPELRGSVSKTRLFGQSHWMSSFEHVSGLIHVWLVHADLFVVQENLQLQKRGRHQSCSQLQTCHQNL